MSSPVPRHDRRPAPVQPDAGRAKHNPQRAADPRWSLLDLVRTCRDRLGLRDRDVTVLRGLLSLVPASARGHELVVFASNRVLSERCDGIDERTLRRRIAHLGQCGLLARRTSPNGKRYQLRDPAADIRLTYGIDLTPLFVLRDHLAALAEQCRRDAVRTKALRAAIRDMLYHHAPRLAPALAETARRALRRVLGCDALEAILTDLRQFAVENRVVTMSGTEVLSASDSQNDRHIQNSDKEDFDSEPAMMRCAAEPVTGKEAGQGRRDRCTPQDMTVDECMDRAPNAAAFATGPARCWDDVVRLSGQLAPAIGLQHGDVDKARQAMGVLGCALAVIGLVESFGRVRNPRAYLQTLVRHARLDGLDPVRMFRSLTAPSAGQGGRACIPG